jgi:hypothetical protein
LEGCGIAALEKQKMLPQISNRKIDDDISFIKTPSGQQYSGQK